MKRFYNYILKATNWVLTFLLACLGFSGCDNVGVAEYGTPHSDFTIKGKVTNQKGEEVPNIRISTIYNNKRYEPYSAKDTTYTNSNGDYSINIDAFGIQNVQVLAEDIDGEQNGTLQSDSTKFDSSEIKLKGGKGWYNGKGEKIIDFKLKEKE